MYEQGAKFEFIINKIENNTLFVSQIVQNNSDLIKNCINGPCVSNANNNTNATTVDAYDSDGAATYIVVVVLIYGFSIIFFIGSQVRSTKSQTVDVDSVDAEKVLRSMEHEIFSKEVLLKLSDKHLREKAWKIYVQDGKNQSGEEDLADLKEIERIENKIRLDTLKTQSSFKKELTRKLSMILKIDKYDLKEAETSKNNQSSRVPLLVLQTDEDGFNKLKSKLKEQKVSDETETVKNNSLNRGLKSSIKRSNPNANNSVTFDMFEITEQVSTV